MNNRRTTGIFSIFCAIFYIVVGITHYLMPQEQLHFSHGARAEFFVSIAKGAMAFHIHYWAFIVASLLAIGVVCGLRTDERRSLWLKFVRTLAIIGLALTAIDFARMHAQAIRFAGDYINASPVMQDVIIGRGIDRLDAYGLSFSMLGIWLLTISYSAIRTREWPGWIALMGIFNGVMLQFVLVGTVAHSGLLINMAAGLGGVVVTPILFIGIGTIHLREIKGARTKLPDIESEDYHKP